MPMQSPRILGFTSFEEIGFYDFLYLRDCLLKAMQRNLYTEPGMPEQIPTRQSLVGIFHHKVMELVFKVSSLADLNSGIESEILSIQKIVDAWTHLRRSGSVSGWDEINISATLAPRLYKDIQLNAKSGKLGLEAKLRSTDGKLIGRPDFFYVENTRAVLKELKSSSLRDDDRNVRTEFIEQIQFYALLLFDSFPIISVNATLESSRGEHISFSFISQDVEPIRATALASFENANKRISSAKFASDLATPSVSACRGCEKRIVCEVFKKTQFSLGLESDAFVLDGFVGGISQKSGGKVLEISVKEEFSGSNFVLTVPATDGGGIIAGKHYLFSDLTFQSGKFRWSERTRVFSCE